jgi:hypothetical protein
MVCEEESEGETMIGEGIIRWLLVVTLGTVAFVTAGIGCSGAGGGSSGSGDGRSTSSGGSSSSGSGSGGSTSGGGGSGSGSTSGGSGSGSGSSSGSHGGSGGSSSGSSGGNSSGGGDSGVGLAEAGVPSKCPGYAVPPALGTTITLLGTSSTMMEQILPLGCMHLVSNRWTDPMAAETLFLNVDSSFGWSWQRGNTGPMYSWGSPPNYPEIEFGINPWGLAPGVSTTDLLPMQFKNMHSASMTVSVDANIMKPDGGWNLAYEMWLSPDDPTKGMTNPQYEIMVFFGNGPTYYPTSPTCDSLVDNVPCGQQVESGGNSYTLFFSSTQWSGPPAYNYMQFRDSANSSAGAFSGTLDIYMFLQTVHPSGDLWVTRFELGNEAYENTQGATTITRVSFEVNGTTETALMNYD